MAATKMTLTRNWTQKSAEYFTKWKWLITLQAVTWMQRSLPASKRHQTPASETTGNKMSSNQVKGHTNRWGYVGFEVPRFCSKNTFSWNSRQVRLSHQMAEANEGPPQHLAELSPNNHEKRRTRPCPNSHRAYLSVDRADNSLRKRCFYVQYRVSSIGKPRSRLQ